MSLRISSLVYRDEPESPDGRDPPKPVNTPMVPFNVWLQSIDTKLKAGRNERIVQVLSANPKLVEKIPHLKREELFRLSCQTSSRYPSNWAVARALACDSVRGDYSADFLKECYDSARTADPPLDEVMRLVAKMPHFVGEEAAQRREAFLAAVNRADRIVAQAILDIDQVDNKLKPADLAEAFASLIELGQIQQTGYDHTAFAAKFETLSLRAVQLSPGLKRMCAALTETIGEPSAILIASAGLGFYSIFAPIHTMTHAQLSDETRLRAARQLCSGRSFFVFTEQEAAAVPCLIRGEKGRILAYLFESDWLFRNIRSQKTQTILKELCILAVEEGEKEIVQLIIKQIDGRFSLEVRKEIREVAMKAKHLDIAKLFPA